MQSQVASQAKISRPQQENIYYRDTFFNILDECRSKPLIWLTAPPGAGKTTLISSYVESRKLPCLWYQVDSNDADPATFFHYLGLSAFNANPRRKKPLPHLTPEYIFGLPAFTQEYFSEMYRRINIKSFIVFDNYQEAPYTSILHEIIHNALSCIPKGVNIIIISRSSPPPILSRLRLKQLMEVVTWEDIRLTTDEAYGIASTKGKKNLSDAGVRSLLLKTDGWVAGLVLLLESEKSESLPYEFFQDKDHYEVFEYFSDQFFQKLKDSEKAFLVLTSLLPCMTVQMAVALTGNQLSSRILESLNKKSYFIHKHLGAKTRYQFHPLFREFLLTRLSGARSSSDMAQYSKKAAELLAADLQLDHAVTLFCKPKAWDSIAEIIYKEAASLLDQGRHKTLMKWLDLLPEDIFTENPWLLFWKGNCFLPYDQNISKGSFETAFNIFYKADNPEGLYLSWSGVADSIIHAFDDFKPLDHWISMLENILHKYPSFPSKEVEARVTLFIFLALSFRAPEHPDMGRWAEKTYTFFNEIPEPNIKARFGLCLVDYLIWTGDLQRANLIIEELSKEFRHNEYTPLSLLSIKLSESLNNWFLGRFKECITSVTEGLETSENTGIKIFDYFFYGHGAVSSLTSGDLDQASKYIKKADAVLNKRMRFCASYYHHIVACHKLLINDFAGALEHEKVSMALSIKVGSPFAEAMTHTSMALICYMLGEDKRADKETGIALKLARSTGSTIIEYIAHLFNAYFALDSGNRRPAAETLQKAMSIGRMKGYVNFHMWHPDIMAKLCVFALEEEIEVEYTCRLIRIHDLFPEKPPLHLKNWPWRLKISIADGLEVEIDGKPLQYSRKPPKIPIDMIKLLIIFGGRNVPEHRISDILWPDADGDAAYNVFTTTLTRLRRLLVVDNTLLVKDGTLTLNPRHCCIDIWAFDAMMGKLDDVSARSTLHDLTLFLEHTLSIWNDGFDAVFDEIPEAMRINKRRKNRVIRSFIAAASKCEEAGEIDKAIEIYRSGIKIDSSSGELYERFINCQKKHFYKRDGQSTYSYPSIRHQKQTTKSSNKKDRI